MAAPDPLVDPAWLATRRDDPDLRIVHVGWSAVGGTAEAVRRFEEGHVPGAAFLDVDRDLAGTPFTDGPGRHPLPAPDRFAETMATVGVGDDTVVVSYDDAGGSLAARLWWMLAVTGHGAHLLDGGLGAWRDGGGTLAQGSPAPHRRAPFTAVPWPRDRIVDASDVAAALRAGAGAVLDARAGPRYRGEEEPIDPVAGHVPGARSAPWQENLGADGRFRSPAALAARYRTLGVIDASAIVYCGSGVTSCLDLVGLCRAGVGMARLYVGSWSDWVHDPARAVATGPEPGVLA